MKSWIISICAISILSTIIILVLPDNKVNNLIKKIILLILSVAIILPIFNMKNIDLDNLINNNSNFIESGNDSLLNFISNKKLENYQKIIKEKLLDLGINGEDIEIEYSIDENYYFNIETIKINLKNAELKIVNDHIVTKDEIISSVKDIINKDVNCEIYD